jgi:hypothetical protein
MVNKFGIEIDAAHQNLSFKIGYQVDFVPEDAAKEMATIFSHIIKEIVTECCME